MNAGFRYRFRLPLFALIAFGCLLSCLPGYVSAQDQSTAIPLSELEMLSVGPRPQERYLKIILALGEDGYTVVDVRQTFLNRVLIRAENQHHLRETVVSRASGQVLRDVIIEEFETR